MYTLFLTFLFHVATKKLKTLFEIKKIIPHKIDCFIPKTKTETASFNRISCTILASDSNKKKEKKTKFNLYDNDTFLRSNVVNSYQGHAIRLSTRLAHAY